MSPIQFSLRLLISRGKLIQFYTIIIIIITVVIIVTTVILVVVIVVAVVVIKTLPEGMIELLNLMCQLKCIVTVLLRKVTGKMFKLF
jgi:hypothetical protein